MTAPPSLENLLSITATELDRHANDTLRTIEAWSALTLGGSGPGQVNAVSDPTGSLVASFTDHHHDPRPLSDPCVICTAMLARRWVTAATTIRHAAVGLCGPLALGAPLPTLCRALAANVRRIAGTQRHQLGRACGELRAIMLEARPMSIEDAHDVLDAEARMASNAQRCIACDSPEVKLKAKFGQDCYDMRQRQIQRGRFIDDETFVAEVRAGVARGDIVREASPLFRTAVPRLHEGEVA